MGTPGSYAGTLGVKSGWEVVSVGSAAVKNYTTFELLTTYFDDALRHFPQVASGLRVQFLDQRSVENVFYFQHRPLGICISTHPPFKVESFTFNSCAKERGVQVGWIIKRIADQDVSIRHTDREVEGWLMNESADLAVWPLRVDFETRGGIARTFFFDRQPLGMKLQSNGMPVRVGGFQSVSYAKKCGVQVGWAITRVGDAIVSHNTSFEKVIEYLVEGARELPSTTSAPDYSLWGCERGCERLHGAP